jgi:hypothetical protein
MRKSVSLRVLLAGSFTSVLVPIAAAAGIHTWDVREVFSNADGTIQYVELWEAAGGSGETGVGNGSLSSNTQSFAIGNGSVAPPTTNKSYLLATAGFAALPGAPTPDKIIPAGNVPFFNTAGDLVSFVGIDSWSFGAVPTNGISSLDRITGVGTNTPKNYAGTQGQVDASGGGGGPDVPLLPGPMVGFALLLVMGVGIGYLVTARPQSR